MPARRIRVDPASALREGFAAVRGEVGLPIAYPAAAQAEAEAAAARAPGGGERVDVPFVTIDPPGARDLDQALHIERRGDGHRVRYAIADVGAFVAPAGARRPGRVPRAARPAGRRPPPGGPGVLPPRGEGAPPPAGPLRGRGEP